jgi:hypothetical protein
VVASVSSTELTPFYYRDNFLCLCDTVESQYLDLLRPGESEFLSNFRDLSFPAQCLYVRLVSRVGPWFRVSRLHYEELTDIGPLLAELTSRGLLLWADSLEPSELGTLYTRRELQTLLAADISASSVSSKPELLDAIAASPMGNEEITRRLCEFDGAGIVAPLGVEHVELLQLLFFGNRRQSLTEFVLSDLGVARYFPYPMDRRQRLFASREALDEYLACAALGDRWYELREADAIAVPDLLTLAADLSRMKIRYDSSRGRYSRLCNSLARELERREEVDAALALYALSDSHPCRERRLRILERTGRYQSARELCRQLLERPWCEEERDAAERIMTRLRRVTENKPQPRRQDCFQTLHLELPEDASRVELLAAQALERQWDSVRFVENKLMNALFGLAFWEQIFAAVPGAFHNPFQGVPSDMYQRGFRLRREQLLARRFAELAECDLREEIGQAYKRYQGYQCRWLNWRVVDEQLVETAVSLIPRQHLLAIWERMLFDPGENRRGFPDLIALGESPGDYCLVEVKGPGDALQYSQKRWLRFFREQEIPAQVAWVVWRHG